MPARSRPADYAYRRLDHHDGGSRRNHDGAPVLVTPAVRTAMLAAAAAFRRLGDACKAQQGGECGN